MVQSSPAQYVDGWQPNPYIHNMNIVALEIRSLTFYPPYPYSPSFEFGFQHIELIGPFLFSDRRRGEENDLP